MDEKFSIRDDDVIPPVSEATTNIPDEEILTTPLIEAAWRLYSNCRTVGGIGVIQGPSGTGKSAALRAILARHSKNQLPGTVHRILCSKASGPSSGVRAILLDLGVGGAVTSNRSVAGLHYLLKLAGRELAHRNVAALLLDDADYYEPETIIGIIGLFDQLKESHHRFTLILTGVLNEARWIGQVPAASTRTLHIERTATMDAMMTAAVLKQMGPSLEQLIAAQKDDEKARAVLRFIHKDTGGIFRRIRFFADMVNEHPEKELTLNFVEEILGQMQN